MLSELRGREFMLKAGYEWSNERFNENPNTKEYPKKAQEYGHIRKIYFSKDASYSFSHRDDCVGKREKWIDRLKKTTRKFYREGAAGSGKLEHQKDDDDRFPCTSECRDGGIDNHRENHCCSERDSYKCSFISDISV